MKVSWFDHNRADPASGQGGRPGIICPWTSRRKAPRLSVMPFTSDLLGKFSENPLAVDIFALNLLLANVATQGMLEFGERHELIAEGKRPDPNLSRLQALTSGVVIMISIAVAWSSPTLAEFCWLGFAAVPHIADGITRARRARGAGHPGGGHSRPCGG